MFFAIQPGRLNTTRHAAALTAEEASAVLNCDTGRGVFELDLRYRRWQVPPLREYTTGGDLEECSAWSTGAADSQSRSGGVSWSGLTNIAASDDAYATCGQLAPGGKTQWLRVLSFVPVVPLPAGAELLSMRVEVEASAQPHGAFLLPAIDDQAEFLDGGSPLGANLAKYEMLTETDVVRVYELEDLTGLTVADVNAGDVGFRIGWIVDPENPAVAYDPGNWSVGIAPTSPQSTSAQGTNVTASLTTAFVVTLTWTGPGAAPKYVLVSLTGIASADTAGNHTEPQVPAVYGTASVNNGLGGTATHTAPDSEGAAWAGASASTTARRWLAVDAGVASTTVTMTSSATTSGFGAAYVAHQLSGAVVSSESWSETDKVTVRVDRVRWRICYRLDTGETAILTGAQALGYGVYGGLDEYTQVWGRGVFRVPANFVALGIRDDWSAELSSSLLASGSWFVWQYQDRMFYTSPADGVYSRVIGEAGWEPLYRDTQSPGSTGDATAANFVPPYIQQQVFDSAGGDTVTADKESGGPAVTPTFESGLVQIATADRGSGYAKFWTEFEVELATPRAFEGNCLAFRIQEVEDLFGRSNNDGFSGSPAADLFLKLTNTAAADETVPLQVYGKLDQQGGEAYYFADLSSVDPAILADVAKILIRFVVYQTGRATYRLTSMLTGGVLYKDGVQPLSSHTAAAVGALEYAYDFDETGPGRSQARTLVVPALTHLGLTRSYASAPSGDQSRFAGSQQLVRVPVADAPYSPAGTIRLMRKVGDDWHKIAEGTNAEMLVYYDKLPDSAILADLTTYPVVTPSFDPVPPSESGQASGIRCGCAWKGSNVYAHTNGRLYMSRTGAYGEVEWDDVVLTNDPGSFDEGPARTITIADDTVSPVVLLVPAENLYCFTERECYVLVSGDTAFNSSFPRKIDGVRGALGMRAGCVYGDRALVGCRDGLWSVKKSTDFGEQPDELIEVTSDVRGSWAWLLGNSPSTVVVRQLLGEIWCFNAGRYLHLTRTGRWIPGQWADGREVLDAVSDPARGLVLLMSDGHLGVLGPFRTDGGADVSGQTGVPVEWMYRTPLLLEGGKPLRATAYYEASAAAAVSIEALTEEGDQRLTWESSGRVIRRDDYRRYLGGSWCQFVVRGRGGEVVMSAGVEIEERAVKRTAKE